MEEKRNRHIILWTIIALLLLSIIALTAYIVHDKKQQADEESAEQTAWLQIQKWEGLMQLDSLETAINQYQNTFIHGRHADMVESIRIKIEAERRDWLNTQYSDSIEAIEDFVRNHSDSYYRDKANHKIDSLSYIEATDIDNYDAYERYLDSFSDGMYAAQARKRMDDLDNGTLSDKEQADAIGTLDQHFAALATADAATLKNTVTSMLTTYIGQNDASKADVEQYMKRMHTDKERTISFTIQNPIVTKEVNEHKPTYNIHFVLEEQAAKGNSTNTLSFVGLAKINSEYQIQSLMLSQK